VRINARIGRQTLPAVVVFLLALVSRLLVPFSSTGGLRGLYNYDPSVYYAASDALLSGRVPYRDFNLVHPPLLPLVLTPFAALGRLTTDHTGFVLGNLAFTVVGAVNAVLVLVLCRRVGLRRGPALLAGLFYAVWFGSVNAEFTVRLEPLGNLLFLLGLLLLTRARARGLVWSAAGAGALFGLTCTVKIWWLLPVAVMVAESLVRRRWREAAAVAAGAIAGIAVVCAPFAVLAGHRMYRLVILGQTGRARLHGNLAVRLQGSAIGLSAPWAPSASIKSDLAIATFVLVLVAAVLACRVPAARVFVVLAAVQVIALLRGPSWYPFYDDWLAVPCAIILAAGAEAVTGLRPRPVRRLGRISIAVAVVAAFTGSVSVINLHGQGGSLIIPVGRTRQLVHAARQYGGCLRADSPMLLIEADALTRSFDPPCSNAVDVTSPRLGIDGPALKTGDGFSGIAYKRYLVRYLTAGDTVMVVSLRRLRLTRPEVHAIKCGGVVTRAGTFVLYRVRACSHLGARLPR
jgi:alpha-1,2-mannosyltransferase